MVQVFDKLSVGDERLLDIARRTNTIYPLAMLKLCITRHYDYEMTDEDIKVTTRMESQGRKIWYVCDMEVQDQTFKVSIVSFTSQVQSITTKYLQCICR